MKRLRWILACGLSTTAVPLLAHSGAPQNPGTATTVPPTPAPTPAGELIGLGEEQARMTVPVSIGARGPYNFVIDTGAERTVVSSELAGALGLATGRRVRLTTMAGTGVVDTVLLPTLGVSAVKAVALEAPSVDARFLGAPGMIGLDALKNYTVAIDFDKNVMEVRRSKWRGVDGQPGDIVVRAKNIFGQLIVTDARYRGRRISVVIDTGSPITIGNSALLAKVKTEKSLGEVNLLSVTGQYLKADYRIIDSMNVGGIGFQNLPIAFADALPFKRFGLTDTPAMMLGMDVLKKFRRVQIDFANREIRLTLPKAVLDQRDPTEAYH